MPDPNRFDETWSTEAGDPLDLGLVAAFGPDSGPPLPAGASVVEALRDILAVVPRVQLREPQFETLTPVHPPASSEMPADPNRLETPSGLQVHGLIARGGMGAILKGRDVDLGRDVAVKVLLETHKGRTELAQRFVEEAQIAGQLQHPGIVPVYKLGVFPDRRPYFTMKLVKGQTLATLLAERGNAAASFQLAGGSRQVENLPPQPDLARFVGIFAQICQTVAYAHARGVIHRDLKPSNIMVGAFAEVQVMDWGLAKVLKQGGVIDDVKASREHKRPEEMTVICTERAGSATPDGLGSQTQAGSILGTPSFMAPEQARGDIELIDERADVFGLGAILCVILTGQPPFVGTTAEAQRKAQTAKLDDAFARLDNCAAEGDLIALAKSCLAAEPWDRPRNASEVADAVTAYQQSVTERLRKAELDRAAAEARVVEEARTRHMAEAKALEERKRRRATLAFATALLALVITGGGAAAWWWNQRTALVRDVEAALTEAATHQDAGRWPEVRVALERAEGRLGGGGPADLREKVRLARLDADTILELDEIRLKASEIRQGVFDKSGPATQYLAAFRKYGLTMPEMDVSEAVAKIRASPVSTPLLAALEDFRLSRGILGFITDKNGEAEVIASVTATGAIAEDGRIRVGNQIVAIGEGQDGPLVPFHGSAPGKRGTTVRLQVRHEGATESQVYTLTRGGKVGIWLEEVLTRADDNAWRKAFREAETAKNYEKMKVLATEPEVLTQPPAVIDRLAIALRDYGLRKETAALLRQAQQRYPNDFWINLNLGGVLSDVVQPPQLEEALGYLRVAVAVRPISAAAHNNLGRALMSKKEYEAAIHEYRESIRLDPNYAASHTNLAAALRAEAEKALGGMEKK